MSFTGARRRGGDGDRFSVSGLLAQISDVR